MVKFLKKNKEAISSLSIYFTANIVQVVVGLVMTPLTSTYLSHYDFSVIGYFNSFSLFVFPFIGFSFASFYAKNYFSLDNTKREELLSTLLIGQAVLGFISILIMLFCLKIYFIYNSIQFNFFPYSIYLFGTIYFNNYYSFLLMNYKLSKNPKEYVRLNIFQIVFNNALTVLFVIVLKMGANGSMGGYFLSSLIIGLYSFKKQIAKLSFDFEILKSALNFSWPLIFSAFLTYFFNGFERLLLEKKDNIIEFGLFNVANKIASFFSIFAIAINTTFEPDFYAAISKKDNKKLANTVIKVTVLIFIPVLIFLLLGDVVVGILTNFKYTEASNYTRILIFSNFIRSISFSLSTIIIAYGFTKISLIEKTIGSFFAIMINYIMIKHYSFYGGAWSQSLNYLVMTIISLLFLKFYIKKRI